MIYRFIVKGIWLDPCWETEDGGLRMNEYSRYFDKWKMSWVVAYLMEFYFENRPTSNKKLSRAFWTLMGKNVEIRGKKGWTDGKQGVPNHIHGLTKQHILAEAPSEDSDAGTEFPEHIYTYVLGDRGQGEIDAFLFKYPKHVIDREIIKYLGDHPGKGIGKNQ